MRLYANATGRVGRCTDRAFSTSFVILPLVLLLIPHSSFAIGGIDHNVNTITEIADVLKKQLGIVNPVVIKLVEANRLALSVEPADHGKFLLLIDSRFLSQLDDEEVTAAVAHELGHVWIYTHHPFLHTEALANQIAMRSVSRDSLKKLYVKLWQFEGVTGNIDDVLDRPLSQRRGIR